MLQQPDLRVCCTKSCTCGALINTPPPRPRTNIQYFFTSANQTLNQPETTMAVPNPRVPHNVLALLNPFVVSKEHVAATPHLGVGITRYNTADCSLSMPCLIASTNSLSPNNTGQPGRNKPSNAMREAPGPLTMTKHDAGAGSRHRA